MERVCYIEQCYQCRYCGYDSEYAYDVEGYCYHEDEINGKYIEDVRKIPKWCKLEVKKK